LRLLTWDGQWGLTHEGLAADSLQTMFAIYSPAYDVSCDDEGLSRWYLLPRLLYDRLRAWEETSSSGELAWVEPKPVSHHVLVRTHSPRYVARNERMSRIDPQGGRQFFEVALYPDLLEFFLTVVGGTVLAAEKAVQSGVSAMNLAGGFHHAFRDRGGGFCVYNDIAVAAMHVLATGKAKQVLIIDCDAHQGDGTAGIFRRESRAFTFSIHNNDIFPPKKRRSDLDIALRNGTGDDEYLTRLRHGLAEVPDLPFGLVLYVAGADVHEGDSLAGLKLTTEGIAERDRLVRGFAEGRRTPVAVVTGGGYGEDTGTVLDIRENTVRTFLGASR